ncbi:hypothetical protein EVAR_43843_1 [Eumeta japonica]|uniref:Uncharacterized protein n=1 Tax=Eumeta variegata TaxID=151549 RepID=A0A4C1WZ16_EUMVA|nr:hypothetical protein EVAR_43843_1 [Eumeta japonica]
MLNIRDRLTNSAHARYSNFFSTLTFQKIPACDRTDGQTYRNGIRQATDVCDGPARAALENPERIGGILEKGQISKRRTRTKRSMGVGEAGGICRARITWKSMVSAHLSGMSAILPVSVSKTDKNLREFRWMRCPRTYLNVHGTLNARAAFAIYLCFSSVATRYRYTLIEELISFARSPFLVLGDRAVYDDPAGDVPEETARRRRQMEDALFVRSDGDQDGSRGEPTRQVDVWGCLPNTGGRARA